MGRNIFFKGKKLDLRVNNEVQNTKNCDLRHFTPKSYGLKKTIWKSDNNKQIWAPNDYNKQHFLCSNLMSWPGLVNLITLSEW